MRAERRGEGFSEETERRALWIVAIMFFVLIAYVVAESASALWTKRAPEATPQGLAVSALALVIMPLLATAKLRVGRSIGSKALVAHAKESFACAWLAGGARRNRAPRGGDGCTHCENDCCARRWGRVHARECNTD